MKDYYLKFADKQEMTDKLTAVNNQAVISTHDYAVDIIGVIYRPTGVFVENEYGKHPELQQTDGYHVNIRMINGDLPASLTPYCITPLNPIRQFGS
jgi:hypothetical protein